mmetsp:Transcript_26520/g.103323  ORF Transcript_26520/g.103323 Transcript_26520/m.103323 type:complete len:397 (-) Transcript_26520:81-1271(-)
MVGFVGLHGLISDRRLRCLARCSIRAEDEDGNGSDDRLPAAWPMLNRHITGDVTARTIAANGEVSCRVVTATGLVNAAASVQKTSPVASAALGRAMICGLLLSAGKKEGETVQLELRGDGPLKTTVAISNGRGEVRGYVGDPSVVLPPNSEGHLDVGKAVGRGILAVVRNHPMWKNPYTGLTTIVSGEVAEDVASYLADSEQTPSALGAGVLVDKKGEVLAAGGFLVSMLPGATEDSIRIVEQNVQSLNMTPTELIRSGMSAADITGKLMKGLDPLEVCSSQSYCMQELGLAPNCPQAALKSSNWLQPFRMIERERLLTEKALNGLNAPQVAEGYPKYYCSCGRDRVRRTVVLLGRKDIEELIAEQGHVEATCEFCKRCYKLSPEEAMDALNAAAL